MSIKKIILLNISRKIKFRDKIILYFFRKYTLNIYKMGYDDGYNFKDADGCKKAEKIKIINIENKK